MGGLRGEPAGRSGSSESAILEDEEFLRRFYKTIPEEQNPRQKYVVKLEYKGQDPKKVFWQYVLRELLFKQLSIPKGHFSAHCTPGIQRN